MNVVIFTSPFDLAWQTDVFGAVILTMFIVCAAYSTVSWRRGRRIYGVLMISAGLYGVILETVAMMVLHIYHRGTFQIMINPAALPFVPESTPTLPLYVVIYYPTLLFIGYKVVEALRVTRPLHAAALGGLFMIALDAPYTMQGHLEQLSWWSYNESSRLVQFVGPWPMIDFCWLATCHALFFAIITAARPAIDPRTVLGHTRWSTTLAAVVFPTATALLVLAGTSIILSPMAAATLLGLPQWLVAAALMIALAVISAGALRATTPCARPERVTAVLMGIYTVTFAVMIVYSVGTAAMSAGAIAAQVVGLTLACLMTAYPAIAHRSSQHRRLRPGRDQQRQVMTIR